MHPNEIVSKEWVPGLTHQWEDYLCQPKDLTLTGGRLLKLDQIWPK